MIEALFAAGASWVVALVLTHLIVVRNGWTKGLDHPREQSLHQAPVPRLGGIAILGGVLIGGLCLSWTTGTLVPPAPLLGGLALIVMVSLWDDLQGHVAVWLRLIIQLAAALLVVWPRPVPACLEVTAWLGCLPVWPTTALVALGVVWMVNLYNFMDGADGLAGGMAVIGFTALGIMGLGTGDSIFAAASFVVAAAALGFLVWNLPPASIFMGDAGSTSLGFLAAAFTLWGAKQNLFPPEAGLLVFGPFIVDAMATLGRRLYRRERIWQPHRTHYYQRLILAGYGVRQILGIYYGLMLLGGASALLFVQLDGPARGVLLMMWAGFHATLLGFAEITLRRQGAVIP